MTAQRPDILLTDRLTDEQLTAVRALISAATAADGVRPLDEQAMLTVTSGRARPAAPGSADTRHVIALHDTVPIGYAHLEPAGDQSLAGDLVVHPAHRRRGIGSALLDRSLQLAGDRQLRIWAHGPHPDAEPLASSYGMTAVRELWRMRRPLLGPAATPLSEPDVPDGVEVRTFRPGLDDEAWLRANAAAFHDHPEQGRLTLADLSERMAQPWFRPDGFFVALAQGRIIGFHWTKTHDPPVRGEPPDAPAGEIYVLGVAEPRPGLGKALAIIGLRHLAGLGLPVAMLFTESTNAKAIHLYEKLGFTRSDVDVMYARK